MSDNTTLSINTGSGDSIRDKDRAGVKTQIVGLDLGIGTGTESLMAGVLPISAAALPLPSGAATSGNQATEITALAAILTAVTGTLVVSAASLPVPSGASTAAKQDTGNSSLASIDGKISACNTGAIVFSSAQPITVSSLPLPSGASTAAKQDTGNTSAASIDTKTPALGQAVAGASVPVVLTAAQLATITPLTTVPVTNAGTFAVQLSSALPAGTAVIGHVIIDSGALTTVTNLSQMGGAAISMGTGVRGAGTQRVTICTDDVVPISFGTTGHGTASGAIRVELPTDGTGVIATVGTITNALPAGTHLLGKVGIDQTTIGITNAVTLIPCSSGGPQTARVVCASGTNATGVTTQGSQIYGWHFFNNAAAIRVIHFYDSASTPTAGSDTPIFNVTLPAGGGSNISWPQGLPFSSGIGYTITTGLADNDTGSCSGLDVEGVILYK